MEEVISPWMHNEEPVTPDMISTDMEGFVYVITNRITNKIYVGQKRLWRTVTRPPLKGKTRKRKTLVQSDWQQYYSSGEEVLRQLAVHGPAVFDREIIHFAYSKGMLNYLELYEQVVRGVLLSDEYTNGIIQVRINKTHLTKVRAQIDHSINRKHLKRGPNEDVA